MNPIKAFKLFGLYERFEAIQKEKASMQVKVPQLLTLFVTLSATIGLPSLVTGWVHGHPLVYMAIVGVAIVLHAVMPSVFAAPGDAETKAAGLTKLTPVFLALVLGAMLAGQARAQGTPPVVVAPANGFVAASDAVAINYKGVWSPGTHISQTFDFLDFGARKTNRVYLEGHELLAPGPGWNLYGGGIKFEPDLSALLKKTNVQADSFTAYISGSAGNVLPSTGNSRVGWMAGGGIKYQITSTLSWQTLQVNYGRFGADGFTALSTGLSFVFGKAAAR